MAIDLITEHIRTKLGQHALRRIYPNLHVVPSNYQTRGMWVVQAFEAARANGLCQRGVGLGVGRGGG